MERFVADSADSDSEALDPGEIMRQLREVDAARGRREAAAFAASIDQKVTLIEGRPKLQMSKSFKVWANLTTLVGISTQTAGPA